jgi:hypothetical protein
VAQLSTLGNMSSTHLFLKAGACLCALIGVWSILVIAHLTSQVTSASEVLVLILPIIYALLAFVPFLAVIYPRLKTPRTSVLVSVSLVEILVFVLFLCAIYFLRAAA